MSFTSRPFTSPVQPVDPLQVAPEREALVSWLDFHRAQLLSKLDGLTAEQAGRRLVGSLTTLHGLVRHMAYVEHVWFVWVLAGSDEPNYYDCTSDRDADFRLDRSDGLDADVAVFQAACERSRTILAGLPLDERRQVPRLGEVDLRWIMIHMVEEYARHTGHADIIRELIDGVTAD